MKVTHRAVVWLATLTAVAATAAQAPQAPQTPKGTAVIVGRVIDGTTGAPIANAAVYWYTPESAVASLPDGRFVLRGVPAGRYSAFALKAGYLQGHADQTRLNGARRLRPPLAEGEIVTDVVIRMWRPASISGRVIDEAGEPLVNVQVHATRQVMRAGRWTFGPAGGDDGSARTDDRGMYRIDGLPPGRWTVGVHTTSATVPTSVATMLDTWTADPDRRQAASQFRSDMAIAGGQQALPNLSTMSPVGNVLRSHGDLPIPTPESGFRYRTQFAGGAASASSAQLLELESGDERAGVDIALRPVRVVSVSGSVSRPDGPAGHVPLRLLSTADPENQNLPPVAVTIADGSGHFTFLDVPPGEYAIRAVLPPSRQFREVPVGSVTRIESIPPPPDAPTWWVAHDVVVSDRDVANVSVTLRRGVRITGRVLFEGVAPGETPSDVSRADLQLERADGTYSGFGFNLRSIPIRSSTFISAEIPPGRYFIRSPSAWRIVAATADGRDILTSPVVLQEGRDLTDVVVTLSKRIDTLTGSVTGFGPNGPAGAVAVVFPADSARWTDYGSPSYARYLVAPVEPSGTYQFSNLAPGEYFLIALASDPGDEWAYPEQLRLWATSAQRVTVTPASAIGPSLVVRSFPRKDPSPVAALLFAPAGAATTEAEHAQSGPWAPDEQPDSAVISGVVVLQDDGGDRPVRKAVVSLRCAEPRVQRSFVTDESGGFLFAELPACRYSITAAKPAFVTLGYGATRPDRPGTPLTLGAGQEAKVTLKLLPGAVIAGTIRNRDGEPMPYAAVQVMRYGIVSGLRQLQMVTNGLQIADARGMYRVYGLPPGEYAVGASAALARTQSMTQITARDVESALQASRTRQPVADDGSGQTPPVVGYATVFFPSTTNPAEAVLVNVDAGEEQNGVDIAMSLERLSRIRLTVVSADGQPPATTQVRIVTPHGYTGLISPVTFAAATTAGGRVELVPLPPGPYTLAVSGTMQPVPTGQPGGGIATDSSRVLGFPEWALVPVTAAGADQELTVRLERGKTLTGRVVFDGASPPIEYKGVSIGLFGPTIAGVVVQPRPQPVSADGVFALDGIVPAAYRVIAGSPPLKGWQIASAIVNGQDAADRPVEISTDVSDVVVTFTDKVAELTGRLQTALGRAAPDYHIIVFATDRSYWLWGSRRSISIRPGTDGTFRTTSLPAGEYFIAAVTDVQQNEWALPEFLETLVAGAAQVSLKLGERTVQDLRIDSGKPAVTQEVQR
jgi:protocatechuate 3,4-dioxygenase beta subunit